MKEAERQKLAARLTDVLARAPYPPELPELLDRARGELSMIETDANAYGMVSVERDALQKAVESIRAGLKQKDPKGDAKRQWAREDISRFLTVRGQLIDKG